MSLRLLLDTVTARYASVRSRALARSFHNRCSVLASNPRRAVVVSTAVGPQWLTRFAPDCRHAVRLAVVAFLRVLVRSFHYPHQSFSARLVMHGDGLFVAAFRATRLSCSFPLVVGGVGPAARFVWLRGEIHLIIGVGYTRVRDREPVAVSIADRRCGRSFASSLFVRFLPIPGLSSFAASHVAVQARCDITAPGGDGLVLRPVSNPRCCSPMGLLLPRRGTFFPPFPSTGNILLRRP